MTEPFRCALPNDPADLFVVRPDLCRRQVNGFFSVCILDRCNTKYPVFQIDDRSFEQVKTESGDQKCGAE
jgi:hypothetical protein